MPIETALVLAAGLGSRLGQLTVDKPKAMVLVRGRPMIDWQLLRLRQAGVKKIVVNVHYEREVLIAHLVRFAKENSIEIQISEEEVLLGTGGAVAQAHPLIGDNLFWMVNCDVDTDFDFIGPAVDAALKTIYDGDTWGALVLRADPEAKRFGSFEAADGLIGRMLGSSPVCSHQYMFTGMQILGPKVFNYARSEFGSIFDQFYLPAISDKGSFGAIVHSGHWLDLGTVDDLATANNLT